MNCPFCKTSLEEHKAGNCLDAWIAKLIGCKVIKQGGPYFCGCLTQDDINDGASFGPHDDGDALCPKLKKYSNYILAAWGLVDYMVAKQYLISLIWNGLVWDCKIGHLNKKTKTYASDAKCPEAITKAAIAAME